MGDKLARMIINLIVSVMVARYLGPEQLGFWNYLISFALFFTILPGIGMDSIVPREIVKHPEKEIQIVSIVFVLKLIGGIAGFILSLGIFFFYKNCTIQELLPLSLVSSLMIFQSMEVFDFYFKSKLQARYTIYARNSAFLIITCFKLYLIWTKADLIWFIPTNATEIFLGGILIYGFYRSKTQKISFKNLDWKLGKSLLKDGLPLALSGFLILIYMRIDQIMVTDMIDEAANGIYSTGVKMIEVVYFIPMALGESFFPGIVFAKKQNNAIYQKNLLSFYSIMTLAGLGFTIATTIVAIPMMDLLYGEKYLGSGHVVLIYGLTLYATFINIAVGKYLTTENLLKIIFYRSIIGVGVNLILNWIMIPQYGYLGAAYASLISYYVVTFSLVLFKDSRPQIGLLLKAFHPKYALEKLQEKEG